MLDALLSIDKIDAYVVLGIILFFGLMEVLSGYLHRTQRTFSDWVQEAGSFLMLSALIKPFIVLLVMFSFSLLFPSLENSIAAWNLWLMLPFYLFIDDFLQYWYHRSAHEYPWLWKLHRPHHQAEEMGFFVSYRNAALYYLIMPNIWWVGVVLFLGGAKGVALGLILKQLVIIGSHSTTRWDRLLYRFPALNPLTTVIERVIITPAFHFAHHGKSKVDGISDPNGNYGNMFSIWDQLFGTATFTRQYPHAFGLVNDPKDKWTASIFYPLVTSDKPESEIAKGYQKVSTKTAEPVVVPLEAGKKYLWCACGYSGDQPFCDGSHHGSKHKPVLFEPKRNVKVKLCTCKMTKNPPYCDNSHLKFKG